jgi:predicted RNA-binding protein (virulence factor B family)
MTEIGKTNKLSVLRETDAGLFLGEKGGHEVLLPNSHLPAGFKKKDRLEVFVYSDGEGRLIGSLRRPVAELNQFVCLRVNAVTDKGAFMEWGLEKDLFVPFGEQKSEMEKDRYYVVYIYLDELSRRITGSGKLDKFLSNEDLQIKEGEEVQVMITEESGLGYSCIINGRHKGLIYHSDVYQDLFVGEDLVAYVKTIREDKLIDISLQKIGFQKVLSATDIILEYLEKNNGFVGLHDKSSPEEIAATFNMSKATFKKSIGVLYRHRKVLIKPDGVYLVKQEENSGDIADS